MQEHLKDIFQALGKGETQQLAGLFRRPGGRKHLENLTLILIGTLSEPIEEKQALYRGFVSVLDRMEDRIRRQEEGEEILAGVALEK